MRRITTWLLSTISALVLLFSYHTSTNASAATSVVAQGGDGTASAGSGTADTGATGSGPSRSGSSSGTSSSSGSSSSSRSSSSGSSSASSSKSYTGDAVSTQYGDVQVRITVEHGKITAAKVTQVPWSNGRDQQINGYAVPVLNQEAVAQQSSSIDMVSGASFTSQGYIQSLQSAIDKANL